MKISDEVANYLEGYMDDSLLERFGAKEIAENLVRIFLKDIWKPFDKDDESTFPYPPVVKGEKRWIVRYGEKPWQMDYVRFSHGAWRTPYYVTHYCDPADIMLDVHERKDDD